jgi:hypothetical protein
MPNRIQNVSWYDYSLEMLHISLALFHNEYEIVSRDAQRISRFVNSRHIFDKSYHFNLSHTIELIIKDGALLDEIANTCFKESFNQIIKYYQKILGIKPREQIRTDLRMLVHGFANLSNGRADVSILSKYLLMQIDNNGKADPAGLFSLRSKDEILHTINVSRIMATFPVSIGMSPNINVCFCHALWQYNYMFAPFVTKQDDTMIEESHYQEMKIEELVSSFKILYEQFKLVDLFVVYPRGIAEIIMGFVARVCNLSIDVQDLTKNHKGEIAEIVYRSLLESFIVGTWLIKRHDESLFQRFQEYSTGRDRFMGERMAAMTDDPKRKKEAQKVINDAIEKLGAREGDIASERGDIFETNIGQMADEVWGKDNIFYYLYKRTSETTHGNWRIIAKYHLTESLNPMQAGLLRYNENPNHFAGLIPIFAALQVSIEMLLTVLEDINKPEILGKISSEVSSLRKNVHDRYLEYYDRYVVGCCESGNNAGSSA